MKILLRVLAILLIAAGAVWFLQGVNLLPGSFMTGQIGWAIGGAVTAAAGAALYFLAGRR